VTRQWWGIRSKVTRRVYSWGSTQEWAELLWAGTSTPSRYEVVRLDSDGWVAVPAKSKPQDAPMVPGSMDVADLVLERIVSGLRRQVSGKQRRCRARQRRKDRAVFRYRTRWPSLRVRRVPGSLGSGAAPL